MQYEEILGTNNEVIYRSMEYNESNLLMGFYTESWDEWFTNQVTMQARYRYTSSGWRIRSHVGSVVTRTVRDGGRALGDFEAGGIVRHWNLSGGLGRLGISGNTERSAVRYYFSDHLGSLRAVATSAGTVVEARDYYAFGLEMPGRTWTPSLKTREGYTGHQLDGETGFNYAGARYYNPGLARWMVVDPLAGEFPGWSPYNYVLGNPIRLVDPDGMAPCEPPRVCAVPAASDNRAHSSDVSVLRSQSVVRSNRPNEPVTEIQLFDKTLSAGFDVGGTLSEELGAPRLSKALGIMGHFRSGMNVVVNVGDRNFPEASAEGGAWAGAALGTAAGAKLAASLLPVPIPAIQVGVRIGLPVIGGLTGAILGEEGVRLLTGPQSMQDPMVNLSPPTRNAVSRGIGF